LWIAVGPFIEIGETLSYLPVSESKGSRWALGRPVTSHASSALGASDNPQK